jgi:hypothetical protein
VSIRSPSASKALIVSLPPSATNNRPPGPKSMSSGISRPLMLAGRSLTPDTEWTGFPKWSNSVTVVSEPLATNRLFGSKGVGVPPLCTATAAMLRAANARVIAAVRVFIGRLVPALGIAGAAHPPSPG